MEFSKHNAMFFSIKNSALKALFSALLIFSHISYLHAADETKNEKTSKEESGEETNDDTQEDGATKSKPGSKNAALIDKFSKSITRYTLFEHIMINMTYGVITGGAIGAIGGLSFYNSNNLTNTLSNVQIFALGGVGVGGVSALTIAIIERLRDQPFSVGPGMFNYAWYGAFSGIMLGAATGSILYLSSNDINDVFHGMGYGAMGGLAAGVLLNIILPKNSNLYISFLPGPRMSHLRVSIAF